MAQSSSSATHPALKAALIVIVALAALGVGGVLVYFSNIGQTYLHLGSKADLEGHIYFSVANFPFDSSAYGGVMTVTASAAEGVYNIPKPDAPGTLEYQYRMVATSTKPWVIFVRATGLKGTVDNISNVPFEVYRANLHEVPWSQLNYKIDTAERVTNDPTTEKQFPEISRRGDVIYMARPLTKTPGTSVEDWSVHLVKDGGKDATIAQGIEPKWVSDDQFVFLKSDGLYLYTLSTRHIKQVWGITGKVTDDMTLYVSDDATYVAWSLPEKKTVLVLQAVDWKKGDLAFKGGFSVLGWYPLISPDNRYIALLTLADTMDGTHVPVLGFFELDTLKAISSHVFTFASVYKNVQQSIQHFVTSTTGTVPNTANLKGAKLSVVLTNWLQTTAKN